MSGKDSDPFEQYRSGRHGSSASHYDSTAGSGMSLPSPGAVSNDSKSLFDSDRTDSGFLSGANILSSDQYLSEEISSPSYTSQRSREFESSGSIKSDSKSYMRLDSGVDIGLSEHLSGLNIKESVNDLNDLNVTDQSSGKSSSTSFTSNIKSTPNICTDTNDCILSALPWEIYFEQDEDGDTQLHIAIECNFIEVVYSLIRMVPDPSYLDIQNDAWQTPLHFAVLTGQSRIVRRLLCAGASADVVDIHGNTALHLAVDCCDLQCVQALIEPISAVETQATQAQLKYTPSALSRHTFHYLSLINRFNYEGLACVHLAAKKGSIPLLQLLLWHGADINLREWKSGQTPLHIAVQMRDQKMVEFILNNCIALDLEMPTYSGMTAFQLASHQRSALALYLLQNGADNCPVEDSDEEDDISDEDETNDFLRGSIGVNTNMGNRSTNMVPQCVALMGQ